MSGHVQHAIRHVHANHPAFGTDHLRSDETDLSGTAAEIQHGFTGMKVLAWITTAIVPLDHFFRNDFQILTIVFNRATQSRLLSLGGGGVTVFD
jgi:hypothetical protein